MDRERLEHALKIAASDPGSTVNTTLSSLVNLIIENHEKFTFGNPVQLDLFHF